MRLLHLIIVCSAVTLTTAVPQLVLATALWRHGDRAPINSFPNDHLHEADWNQGGGGYEQLSTLGMSMHFNLGRKLKQRYIDTQFLSQQYNSKEIYVRSTDVNRTIISAISNMIGMYSQADNANRQDVDYPATGVTGWPGTFIPIAVHTVDPSADYIGDPGYPCARRDEASVLVTTTPEFQSYLNFPPILRMLKLASDGAGEELDLIKISSLYGTLFIEETYYPNNISTWYPWYPPIRDLMKQVVADLDDFKDGIGLTDPVVRGIDTSFEIKKFRGGAFTRSINGHFQQKIDVIQGRSNNTFYTNLKYFVVSAHDTTVAAYLALLGAKRHVLPSGGYPQYSSCVLTELFQDDQTGEFTFKIFFHSSADVDFDEITQFVDGCSDATDAGCPYSVFDALAQKYDPGDIASTCQEPLFPTTTTTAA